MTHPEEDTLLRSLLKLLDEHEEGQLREHLAECPECQARFDKIGNDTKMIGSFELGAGLPDIPLPNQILIAWVPLFKAAALLLIGFLVGFGASTISHQNAINVIPQRLQVASPSGIEVRYSSCEPIDLQIFRIPSVPDSIST